LAILNQEHFGKDEHNETKSQEKEHQAAEKQWHKLGLQMFNCQEDAETAAKQFNQGWKFHQAVADAVPFTQYARRGPPSVDDEPEIVGYGLKGSISTDPEQVEAAKRHLGQVYHCHQRTRPSKIIPHTNTGELYRPGRFGRARFSLSQRSTFLR
jgi:hypothetical protein